MVCLESGVRVRDMGRSPSGPYKECVWVWLCLGKPVADFEPGLICVWKAPPPSPFPCSPRWGSQPCILLACSQLGGCQHFDYSSQLSMVYSSTVKQALEIGPGPRVAPRSDLLAHHFYI